MPEWRSNGRYLYRVGRRIERVNLVEILISVELAMLVCGYLLSSGHITNDWYSILFVFSFFSGFFYIPVHIIHVLVSGFASILSTSSRI